MPIIPGVNLPWPLLTYSLSLVFIGLKCTFKPNPPRSAGRASEITTMLGIVTTGLGLAYLPTSYMPLHENQYLYASVPIRMAMAAVAGAKLVFEGRRMTKEQFGEFVGTIVIDGVGGALLGWWLGTWSGRVPGA
jgi:DNA-binding transcriptional LysR family regulator